MIVKMKNNKTTTKNINLGNEAINYNFAKNKSH